MNRLYRKLRNHLQKADKTPEQYIKSELLNVVDYEKLLGPERFKGKLLDLGCGLDYFSKACAIRGLEAEGLDLDKCDFEKDKLPYPDNNFDIITMHELLEHVWNPRNLFEEINRILKREGYLLITVYDWETNYKTFYDDPTRKRPYTLNTLKKLFMTFGMKIILLENKSGNVPWKDKKIMGVAQRMK